MQWQPEGRGRGGKPPHLWNTVLKNFCRWKRLQNGTLESRNRRGWMEMLPDFPDCLKRVPETGRLQAFRRNPAFNQDPLFNPKFYFQSLPACFPKKFFWDSGINVCSLLNLTACRPARVFQHLCLLSMLCEMAGWCLLILSPVW